MPLFSVPFFFCQPPSVVNFPLRDIARRKEADSKKKGTEKMGIHPNRAAPPFRQRGNETTSSFVPQFDRDDLRHRCFSGQRGDRDVLPCLFPNRLHASCSVSHSVQSQPAFAVGLER